MAINFLNNAIGTTATFTGVVTITDRLILSDSLKNSFIGEDTGVNNTTGDENIGLGYNSLFSNTTGGHNTAIGKYSLYSNISGNYNIAIGEQALYSFTGGSSNIGIGFKTLYTNLSGFANIGLGERSLEKNTTGSANIGIGQQALWNNTTGGSNIALGGSSLIANTTGDANVAFGAQSLVSNTTGSDNVAMGSYSGKWIADGSTPNATSENSIFIGKNTKANANSETNQIVIGGDAIGNGSNTVTLGNDSIVKTLLKGNVGIGTDSPDYKLDIEGSANNADIGIRINNSFDDNLATSNPNAVLFLNAASNNGYLRVHGAPANTAAKHQIDLGSSASSSFLTLSPGGSEKMRIDTVGNVGIGTATPGALLQVGGITDSNGSYGSFNIAGSYGVDSWAKVYVVSDTNISSILQANNTALQNGGAYRVTGHIDGTGTDNASRAVFWNQNGTWYCNVTSASGASSNNILFLIDATTGLPSVKTYHASDYAVRVWHERINLNEGDGTDNSRHYFGADAYMTQIGNDISMFTSTYSGNNTAGKLGIGTSNPDYKQHISTSGYIGQFIQSTYLNLSKYYSSTLIGYDAVTDQAGEFGYIYNSVTPADSFSYINTYGKAQGSQFVLTAVGNVGIGTDSPGYKLDVESGNIRVSSSGSGVDAYTFYEESAGPTGATVGYDSTLNSLFLGTTSDNNTNIAKHLIVRRSDGNVGIGTTSPLSKLHVSTGSTASAGNIDFSIGGTLAGNARIGRIIKNTSSPYEMTIRASDFGTQDLLLNDNGGNVGIGTNSPDANLEIDGGNLSKFRISGNGNNGANNEFGSIEFYNNDTSGASPNVASSIKALSSSSTGSGGLLTFSTSIGNEAEGTDANERMRITPTGNVGIGTTSPNANLEISKIGTAEVRVSGLPSGSGYGGNANLWLQTGIYGTSEIAFGPAVAGTAATASGGIEYYDYQKKLTFKTNYSDRVVIDSTGNVGIGTTSPGARLHVDGPTLSNTSGQASTQAIFSGNNSNNSQLYIQDYRTSSGGTWQQSGKRLQMRIDSTYMAYMQFNGTGNDGGISFGTGTSTTQSSITERIRINSAGATTFTSTVTATNFILSSDKRLKNNVKQASNKHIDVNWKTFEMNSEKGQSRYGVIAQELEEVHPEFVRTDDEGMKSVAYIDLLIAKIAELEARLEKLEK